MNTAKQTYQIRFIDRWTGSLRSYLDFAAVSDEDACDHAAELQGADIVELWRGQCLVHRFPSQSDDIYPLSNQHERPE